MKKIPDTEVISTLKKSILADGFDMVLDLKKSKGARLYDAKNQRTLLDFFSFFASNPIGMNHPKLSDKDYEEKLLTAAKTKISNSDIYTEPFAEFVSLFHNRVVPMFDRIFLIEGGALGVENALKTAQDWKVRKNMVSGRGEIGTQVIHFREAFHGRTGYTMSMTNTAPEKVAYFPKFDWPRISNPKLSFPETPESLEKTMEAERKAVQEIEKAFADRPHQICAIIIEPIQAEGGDNFFRAEFLKKLRDLCDQHDALLVFDEVQTGLGLTGKFWAFENYGVVPDLIAFGKKVQVCGCAVRTKRLEEVDHVFKVPSRINSTWGGNLTDMVRSTRFIEIILEENLLENVQLLGPKMRKELEELSKADNRISNVRGLGMFMAFDLPDAETRDAFRKLCWKNGLVILPCGQKSIRIRPILDLKNEEAEEGLALIKKSIKELN